MAAVTYTAAQIAPVDPMKCDIRTYIANEAITKGQPVYFVAASPGRVALADANAAGLQQFRGIALNAAAAGGTVDVLHEGAVYGFALDALNADAFVYLSNNVGAYDDAAGALAVPVGRVIGLADRPNYTRVLQVFVQWEAQWA